jgi:hypothetical protein
VWNLDSGSRPGSGRATVATVGNEYLAGREMQVINHPRFDTDATRDGLSTLAGTVLVADRRSGDASTLKTWGQARGEGQESTRRCAGGGDEGGRLQARYQLQVAILCWPGPSTVPAKLHPLFGFPGATGRLFEWENRVGGLGAGNPEASRHLAAGGDWERDIERFPLVTRHDADDACGGRRLSMAASWMGDKYFGMAIRQRANVVRRQRQFFSATAH